MKKVFNFIPSFEGCAPFPCVLVKDTYANNNRLAVSIVDLETGECWDTITVNLPAELLIGSLDSSNFIDTNNVSEAIDFLESNNIATFTGNYGFSGFCVYPEYTFNLECLITYEEFNSIYNEYYGGKDNA